MPTSSSDSTTAVMVSFDLSEASTASLAPEDTSHLTKKSAFLVTLPVFMAYATCFALQKHLSSVFGLTEGVSGTDMAFVYGIAVSFVYLFNLIFRVFGHSVCFSALSPRSRVIAGLIFLFGGELILALIATSKRQPSIVWVFISYAMVGVCEGTYGPNMLSVAKTLGNTRYYVVIAQPVGIGCITLGSFMLMAIGVPYYYFYIVTAVCTLIGLAIYVMDIFPYAGKAARVAVGLGTFIRDLKDIKQWFPVIRFHCSVFILDMLFMSMFNPGCILYAYNERVTLHILGTTIPFNAFIALYNLGSFLGDFIARKVMDKMPPINPLVFLAMIMSAMVMNFGLIPEIAPLASFTFMFANGSLYTQISKLIESSFKDSYHLTATGTWLFIGDIGSTTGSNLIQFLIPQIARLKTVMY